MSERKRNRVLRSIGAVLAGMLTVIVLSTALDAVMHGTGVFPPEGQPMATALWALATAYRGVFQIFGGYLTARLSPGQPMRHVLVLAFIGLALALLGVLVWMKLGADSGPLWYPLGLVVLAIPTVWAGGKFHERTTTAQALGPRSHIP